MWNAEIFKVTSQRCTKELRKDRNILRFSSLKEGDFSAAFKKLPTLNFIKIEKNIEQIFVSPAYPWRHIIPARSQALLSPTNQKVLLTDACL
jgi:hypothetical protein